eukprot:GGOE01036329.1.p1 GENE.GGOE01036329.1~~GGOE01036329.1.p1  ORF type:complete len:170 (-),score=30.84 GGOE01036329.1:152-661(-)
MASALFGSNLAFDDAVATTPITPLPLPKQFSPYEQDYRWALPSESDLYLQRLERRLAKLQSKGVAYTPPVLTDPLPLEDENDEEDMEIVALLGHQRDAGGWDGEESGAAEDESGPSAEKGEGEDCASAGLRDVPYGLSKRRYYSVEAEPRAGWFEWLVRCCHCLCCRFG